MLPYFNFKQKVNDIPLYIVKRGSFSAWLDSQEQDVKTWINDTGFSAKVGSYCCLPGPNGKLKAVVAVVSKSITIWSVASLPEKLPEKNYYIATSLKKNDQTSILIGWGLGTYSFSYHKENKEKYATLVIPHQSDWKHARRVIAATFFVRDLINMPAEELGPDSFENVARSMSDAIGGKFLVIKGKFLKKSFPAIYAVGKGANQEPRLIDIRWGKSSSPKVTIVGKGVCFDSGGLNLKSSLGIRKMKKDMGGAANTLGLAHMIMDSTLEINLRVLIPVVENAIDSRSYRPGDVIRARNNLTIEVGNTDAEGRIILADALTYASEEKPNLIIDFATLTGAARVALGTELPAVFVKDDGLHESLKNASNKVNDPFWRLPLWENYNKLNNSFVADISNSGQSSYAGAITAALFLKRFVDPLIPWIHIDLYSWNDKYSPGKPIGGEAMMMRGVFEFLKEFFTKKLRIE